MEENFLSLTCHDELPATTAREQEQPVSGIIFVNNQGGFSKTTMAGFRKNGIEFGFCESFQKSRPKIVRELQDLATR